MRIGSFIDIMADTFGLDPKSVAVVARVLREVGLLTSGARGVNAPHMTARDAARLSLALMTGEPPSTVVSEFKFYSDLTLGTDSEDLGGLMEISNLPNGHTVEDALTFLFGIFAFPEQLEPYEVDPGHSLGRRGPSISVVLHENTRNIVLRTKGSLRIYVDNRGLTQSRELDDAYSKAIEQRDFAEIRRISVERLAVARSAVGGRGMRVSREITGVEISTIGPAIAGLQGDTADKREVS